ncbi:septum formation family protein [Arthrobacter sp. UYEF36]|uniref:septum formation family protein n=1 Tax=Arthrobacter sp. UYEF36 TaxID=1756366 RepID=UPI003397DF9A
MPPAAPPAAPARPSVPPVNRPDAGQPGPRRAGGAPGTARAAGAAGAATAALAGAGKVASDKAFQLGGWARRQSAARMGGAVAAVVVMGLLIWWLTSLGGAPKQPVADAAPAPAAATTSAAPASRGPLPLEGVGPLDFQLGDCFKDFDPEAPQSTVVDCGTGHSAQLIGIHHYQATEAYPGLNALKDKGRETCRSAQLAAAATTYTLLQRNAYPSASSWDNGDRRVDCYVTADGGNVIMETLVP